MDDIPRNLFVNARWTDSNLLITVTEHGDQTGEQYSSKGRTYVINALVRIRKSLLTKHRSIWLALINLALETIWSTWSEKERRESILMPRSVTTVDIGTVEPLREYLAGLHFLRPTRINWHLALASLSCHLLAQSAILSIPLWNTSISESVFIST